MQTLVLNHSERTPYLFTGMVQRPEKIEWYVEGKLHRIGAPAVKWEDGSEEWYVNAKLHREGGPALTLMSKKGDDDVHIYWYFKNKAHCTNGGALLIGEAQHKTYFLLHKKIESTSSIVILSC